MAGITERSIKGMACLLLGINSIPGDTAASVPLNLQNMHQQSFIQNQFPVGVKESRSNVAFIEPAVRSTENGVVHPGNLCPHPLCLPLYLGFYYKYQTKGLLSVGLA
jgi:hypothetical protein